MRKFFRTLWNIITAPFRFIAWLFRKTAAALKNTIEFFSEEEDDSDLPEVFAKSVQNPLALLEHLDALRKHLFRVLIYMVITTTIGFTFITPIMKFLSRPLPGGIQALEAIDVTEPVGVVMRVALLFGFTVAFPLIAFELWLFAAPGLKRGERIFSLFSIPIAAAFFLSGMAFAYYLMLPAALPFLMNFMGLASAWRPQSYFQFVINTTFWLGAAFEFPLVIFVLARLGMVNAKMLADQWRIAIVVIAILAAAITTTIDPANMALMMLPMTILYFLSIGLAYLAQRRRSD